MSNDLETMVRIMDEADREHEARELIPLDAEGKALAEHKRFTFDVIETPADPLR